MARSIKKFEKLPQQELDVGIDFSL